MDQKIQNLIGGVATIALLGGMGAGFWYVNSFAKSSTPQRSFQVQGEGKVVAVPDVAEISFGVLTEGGKDLSKLQKDNSDKVNSIIEFLKSNGIEAKDIKTSYYNISPRYQSFSCPVMPLMGGVEMPMKESIESRPFPLPGTGGGGETTVYPDARPCPPSEIIGYSINQSLVVKVRDLSKAGEVLSAVVDRGANNVYGPSFTIDDISALQDQARAEAIAKAKAKAEATAAAGGFKLGKLLSINEGYYMPQLMYAEGMGGGAAMSKDAAPNIEPGSQEVTITVMLVYEIK